MRARSIRLGASGGFAALWLVSASAVGQVPPAPAEPAPETPAPASPAGTPEPAPAPDPPKAAPAPAEPAEAPAEPAPSDAPPAPPGSEPDTATAAPSAPAVEPSKDEARPEPVDVDGDDEPEALGRELSEAEITDLIGETPGKGVDLDVYGFADFNVHVNLNSKDSLWGDDRNRSLYIGNLNVYLDADLFDVARSLIEIRYSYVPQNSVDADDNRLGVGQDYADRNRPVRFGSIEIERAWVEYNIHNLLTVRMGSFLTPYGIWNVDHGSPTVIPAQRPYIIGQGLMPERQTGFDLYGTQTLSSAIQGGYHVTFSNGRGPIDAFADLDKNKAVGGRLWLKLQGAGLWQVGGSTYYGLYTDAKEVAGTNLVTTLQVQDQYKELVFAGDLQWDYDAFHFQAEVIQNQRAYTPEGRPIGAAGNFPADEATWGTYGLVAYRLPFANLMPYFYAEYYDWKSAINTLVVFVGGLNWQPIPALVFKGQYLTALEANPAETAVGAGFSEENLKSLQFQAAWAF